MDKRKRPRINLENDRIKSILEDTPAYFDIERDPKEIKWDLWDEVRTFESYGTQAIKKNNKIILDKAAKHNLDPDLIRAVMFAENARGHKIILNKLADDVGKSNSILPMNIQNKRWSRLINKEPKDLYNPEDNIEAATILLKRIRDRLERPTPEKIGSIWNFSGNEKTNNFGEYIGMLYQEKPWIKIE